MPVVRLFGVLFTKQTGFLIHCPGYSVLKWPDFYFVMLLNKQRIERICFCEWFYSVCFSIVFFYNSLFDNTQLTGCTAYFYYRFVDLLKSMRRHKRVANERIFGAYCGRNHRVYKYACIH